MLSSLFFNQKSMWYMKDYYLDFLAQKSEEELVEFWFEQSKKERESYVSYNEASEIFN